MAEKRDCYEILGIDKNAGEEDIKKAYRRMAKKYHPDVNPGDKSAEEKFKEVNEAYSILSDPEKKANYDRFGYAGVDPSAAGGPGAGGFSGGFTGANFDMGDIFDMFGGMFGGGSSRARANGPMQGGDVGLRLSIGFNDALFGCKREVSYSRVEKCVECGGSGAAKGTTVSTCRKCGGTGRITVQRRTPFGMMQSTGVCDECGGKGKKVDTPCRACRGTGAVRNSRKLEVNIPAGIDDGQRIVLHGQGDAGKNGGPNGDLVIVVSVKKHDLFVRDGFNLSFELPVSFADAALGAKITIPTPDGQGELSIPEGTQSGTVFNVRGKGVPRLNSSGRGDLFVTVRVETPKGLSRKQRDMLREFESAGSEKNYPNKRYFNDKNLKK